MLSLDTKTSESSEAILIFEKLPPCNITGSFSICPGKTFIFIGVVEEFKLNFLSSSMELLMLGREPVFSHTVISNWFGLTNVIFCGRLAISFA